MNRLRRGRRCRRSSPERPGRALRRSAAWSAGHRLPHLLRRARRWTCSALLDEAAGSVLIPVQEAGIIRPEVSPRDILRLGHGIGASCQAAADSAPLLTDVALAGLRVQPGTAGAQ